MSIHKSLAPPLPQAGSWPLLGALPALLRRPFEFFEEARRRHGDIYALRVGPLRPVVLNHPRHVAHVLRDHASNYRKGGMLWDNARKLVGNGLIVSEGEFWLRQRRMMQPQFHRERLARLTDLMVNAIDASLDGWAAHAADGRPVNLVPALAHMTMRIATDTLFGTALPRESRAEVGEAMAYVMNYLMVGAATYGLPSWVPIPGKRRNLREIARLERVVDDIIATTRRDQGQHLLAMLLDVVDDQTGEGMNDRQLHDEVMNMFLAGYETTSTALGWALHFLMGQPEVTQKLQDEVDSALGGRTPVFADFPRLSYTRMVVQEVLRLRPPGAWVPRVAIADDEIDGFPIPAGTEVISLIYMIHRHPDFWPEPDRFDPERFAGDHAARGSSGRHSFAWIPFGVGQRLCIGRDFAMMESTLALAMIVQRYRIAAVKGRITTPGLSSTLRLKGGLWAQLAARDRA
jgi:cytochrome P450